MNFRRTAALLAAQGATALVLGCGSTGSSTGAGGDSAAGRKGALMMNIQFPGTLTSNIASRGLFGYTGTIPVGTLAVKVSVLDSFNGTQTRIVTAPVATSPGTTNGNTNGGIPGLPPGGVSSVPPAVTLTFASVPAGPVTVTAVAYPDAAAAQNPLANASGTGTIVPLQTTNLKIPFVLTLDHITINPPALNVNFGPRITVTATAFNAQNQPVAFPLVFSVDQPSIINVSGTNTPGQVTLARFRGGAANLVVTEVNSLMQKITPIADPGG